MSDNKIYTKTGDDGTTGLLSGERVGKDSAQVAAYGDVDELNSWLGLIRTKVSDSGRNSDHLAEIQSTLFVVGTILSTPVGKSFPTLPRLSETDITSLEKLIDGTILTPLKNFVLPGGCELNALFHIARTVCRRAERMVVALNSSAPSSEFLIVIRYLNRLSDLLFTLARAESSLAKAPEYIWHGKG